MTPSPLTPNFFERLTLTVAPELLGKFLVSDRPEGRVVGRIIEVEAYLGSEDPASHAFTGQTLRNQAMWLRGGHWYVYLIYGLHTCLNVVTDTAGVAGAVLIRSVVVVEGKELAQKRRGLVSGQHLSNGPGKVAQALGVTLLDNGTPMTTHRLWIEDRVVSLPSFQVSPRVGVSRGKEAEWRFYCE